MIPLDVMYSGSHVMNKTNSQTRTDNLFCDVSLTLLQHDEVYSRAGGLVMRFHLRTELKHELKTRANVIALNNYNHLFYGMTKYT